MLNAMGAASDGKRKIPAAVPRRVARRTWINVRMPLSESSSN
jgi:hypothetical protein